MTIYSEAGFVSTLFMCNLGLKFDMYKNIDTPHQHTALSYHVFPPHSSVCLEA